MTGTYDGDGGRAQGGSVSDFDDKVRQLWKGRLSPIRPELLGSEIPVSARNFLMSVGLPTDAPDFTFFHDERLLQPAVRLGRGYLVIGDDSGLAIAVDHERGDVWELYRSQTSQPRFFNSSLPAFLVCLARYLAGRDEIYAAPTNAARIADGLKREFRDWDPIALADETSAWSVSLREIGEGLA